MHTEQVIRSWHEHWDGNVYVSFSGGKDSTVLLHLVRSMYPTVPAVFIDTGLEYPEIKEFVRAVDNVTTIRPRIGFREVLTTHGYPVISKTVAHHVNTCQNPTPRNKATRRLRLEGIKKDGTKASPNSVLSQKWRFLIDAPFKISARCCDVMKKEPFRRYERATGRMPYIGMMASEGAARERAYLQAGCNAFSVTNPSSNPLSTWTEQDILQYIVDHDLEYASCYGDIVRDENGEWITTDCKRTGCMFCMFGVHLEPRPNRFERMKVTHPSLYRYCIKDLGLGAVMDYIGIPYGQDAALPFEDMDLSF